MPIAVTAAERMGRSVSMAEFTLYCFRQSGNAYKAALMLTLIGADWEARFVDFFGGETRSPAYRAINTMGEVPVLLHGTLTLSQSGVILDYLAELSGQFGPETPDERREILRWLLYDNHKFTSYIATLRYLLQFAGTGETPVTEFLRARVLANLSIVDGHLADRPFVIGARPTIADISMCSYLFWPHEFGVSWQDYPHIGRWLDRIAALPGWQRPEALMPDGAPQRNAP
jgi:glutathione S-transferase